jgi:tripartite-type tricarboxylate transporter receptor subunit TctC
VEQVLAEPAMSERAAQLGFRLIGGPPDTLAALLQNEIAKWAEVAKAAGLVVQQ